VNVLRLRFAAFAGLDVFLALFPVHRADEVLGGFKLLANI
jgi:hypothetical protein